MVEVGFMLQRLASCLFAGLALVVSLSCSALAQDVVMMLADTNSRDGFMKVDDYFKKRDETKAESPAWTTDQVSRYALCWMGKRRMISISVEKDAVTAALNRIPDGCAAYAAADLRLPVELTKQLPSDQLQTFIDLAKKIQNKWADNERDCVTTFSKSGPGVLPITAKRACICLQGVSEGATTVKIDDSGPANISWCMGLSTSITARESH
jgi:hypothetical protein